MDGMSCDRCGKGLLIEESARYRMKVRVWAAYDPMEVTAKDLERDWEGEIEALVEQMKKRDPKELEEEVYQEMEFDLCPPCRKAFAADPFKKRG